MAEYIEREAVLEAMCKYCCEYDSENTECICNERLGVLKIPVADVVEVKHGRWINERMLIGGFAEKWGCDCSICGETFEEPLWKPNYCPNCGARMDGDTDG